MTKNGKSVSENSDDRGTGKTSFYANTIITISIVLVFSFAFLVFLLNRAP